MKPYLKRIHPLSKNFINKLPAYRRLNQLTELLILALETHTQKPLVINPTTLAYRFDNHQLIAIKTHLDITLDDLQNIDKQKEQLIKNTEQFLYGYPANHVLMTGARGVGKSSLIKALLKQYAHEGLRVIEVSRDNLRHLSIIRQAINHSDNNNRYIIYCDDLAFDQQDESYRALKSLLDGAMDSQNDDILIYATSNRRHLLPQLIQDNHDIYHQRTQEVNPHEVIDETVSLSDRFGLWLSFHPMTQDNYLHIAKHYLNQANITWTDEIEALALRFAALRGNRSGRLAYQFSRDYLGKTMLAQHTTKKTSNTTLAQPDSTH